MKIKKHGKKFDDGSPFNGKCDSCGCEVEVNRDEIRENDDYRNGSYFWIGCPECYHPIYFIDKRLGNDRITYRPTDPSDR